MTKKIVSIDQSAEAEKQILDNRRSIDYDTIEFPVEVIVSKFNSEEPAEAEWYVPDYQRGFIWSAKFQSVFIESVILNIPIPYMFVADAEDGRLEIVDGSQRIRTLDVFLRDELKLDGLLKLTKLNGCRFSDLTLAEQRRFKNRSLKIIKLSEKAPPEIRAELFHRVNRSAELMESEIRRGSFLGPFYSFIQECSRSKEFLAVCPFSEQRIKRHEPEEYITRYLIYKDHYKEFKHDVRGFLDNFVIDYNESFPGQEKKRHLKEFKEMIEFATKYLPYGFARKEGAKTSARVRFEALSIGITLALRIKPDVKPSNLDWLDSKEFAELTTSDGSNSPVKLRNRVEFVRDQLLNKHASKKRV